MGGSAETTVRRVFPLVLAVCVDLSLFHASGCVLAHCVFGHLAGLWVSALLRCIALTAVTLLSLGDLQACLIRFIMAHSLLPAVFVTGSGSGLVADTRSWLLCAGAALAAALFWELTIPDRSDGDDPKVTKKESRKLFVRVLLMYKPYYHLLAGGLVFLSLAVICKSTTLQ